MVSSAVLLSVASAVLLPVAWVMGVILICRRRMTLSLRNIAIGAAVFLLFALVLEGWLNGYLLTRNKNTADWFATHRAAFVLYAICAAALFEEVGRFLGMALLVRPTGNPGTAVAYGIGHGGMEALIVGTFAQAQVLAMALMLNAGTLEAKLGNAMPPATLAKIRESLQQLTISGSVLASAERLVALLIQIALSLLVWRAVTTRRWRLFAAAIALHAAADLPAAMAQKGYIPGTAVEAFYALLGVGLIVAFATRLPTTRALQDKPRGALV
jgi:uncharacterized membrane protein YhfC